MRVAALYTRRETQVKIEVFRNMIYDVMISLHGAMKQRHAHAVLTNAERRGAIGMSTAYERCYHTASERPLQRQRLAVALSTRGVGAAGYATLWNDDEYGNKHTAQRGHTTKRRAATRWWRCLLTVCLSEDIAHICARHAR